ncbi:MAG TPA: nitroreductase family protein [Candidatus Omnitrophota bacterium]|nr:nitroreductase family protein [Candidatus Omnitrophota bacterium]
METFESISKRASVREYLNQPVPKNLLEKLVDAGHRAPTARAIEPWEFVVVTERQTLDKLAGMISTGLFLKQATACIIVFCQDVKYYLEDGAAATENILLAATDLGLGTCWIAGDKKEYCEEVKSLFGVPATHKLISLISVGWASKVPKQHKKRKLEEVLHWEKF